MVILLAAALLSVSIAACGGSGSVGNPTPDVSRSATGTRQTPASITPATGSSRAYLNDGDHDIIGDADNDNSRDDDHDNGEDHKRDDNGDYHDSDDDTTLAPPNAYPGSFLAGESS